MDWLWDALVVVGVLIFIFPGPGGWLLILAMIFGTGPSAPPNASQNYEWSDSEYKEYLEKEKEKKGLFTILFWD